MKTLVLGVLALAALALAAGVPRVGVDASNPGAMPAPLVSCPNLDADPNGYVRAGDISKTVHAFFNDAGPGFPNAVSPDYVFLYDRNADGLMRAADISNVVHAFFTTCPRVDTEVAQATQWILQEHPELLTEDVDALAAAGYFGLATIDVPGQGVHYGRVGEAGGLDAWDNVFDPTDPEGLVYNNGVLVAQLYVVDGADVGWTAEDPGPDQGSCVDGVDNGGDTVADAADSDCQLAAPSGAPLDDVNIDAFAYCGLDGNSVPIPCSWDGDEGWHLHYRLCLVHIGTPYAFLTLTPNHQSCKDIQTGTCCGGSMFYADRIGWMGHLWNWLPNTNLVPDNGGMNGRFVDCFPDAQKWGPYDCPQ